MEENQVVGYRFHPTDEELVNHYLKNKILGESDEAIGEININDYDPISLRSLAKIQSNDPTWYFLAPTIYLSSKRTLRKRCTKSGYWKPTGNDREIKDKNGKKIGLKKTLVYQERGASKIVKKKNPWVMHEYHIKYWSHPDMESYVICKIKYKGEDGEPSQSLVSDSNTVRAIISTPPEEVEQPVEEENGLSFNDLAIPVIEQDQYFDLDTIFLDGLSENDLALPILNEEFDPNTFFNDLAMPLQNNDVTWDPVDPNAWFNDQQLELQEQCNDYKPRKPLSGIIVYYSSDSDSEAAESISVTSYQGTLSPGDSVGSSSNQHFPSCRDETLAKIYKDSSADSSISRENTESQLTRCIIPSNQEVKEEDLVKTEKKEKTNKNSKYIYLKEMKMIIGLILLLAFIGNIISVLSSTVKSLNPKF